MNTLPPETFDAYRDHGQPGHCGLEQEMTLASELPATLLQGIDLEAVAHQLEIEGVKKFVELFDELLNSLNSDAGGRSRWAHEPVYFIIIYIFKII